MSSQTIPLEHPISRCVAEIGAALDRAAAADPQLLSVHAKKVALVELSRQAERIRGLVLKVLAVSDDVAAEDGSRSPGAWLAHHIRADHGPSARAGRLDE